MALKGQIEMYFWGREEKNGITFRIFGGDLKERKIE
jgi:hypothetical protein